MSRSLAVLPFPVSAVGRLLASLPAGSNQTELEGLLALSAAERWRRVGSGTVAEARLAAGLASLARRALEQPGEEHRELAELALALCHKRPLRGLEGPLAQAEAQALAVLAEDALAEGFPVRAERLLAQARKLAVAEGAEDPLLPAALEITEALFAEASGRRSRAFELLVKATARATKLGADELAAEATLSLAVLAEASGIVAERAQEQAEAWLGRHEAAVRRAGLQFRWARVRVSFREGG